MIYFHYFKISNYSITFSKLNIPQLNFALPLYHFQWVLGILSKREIRLIKKLRFHSELLGELRDPIRVL